MYKKDAKAFLDRVADDEPIFILRAQDICASSAIFGWCELAYLADASKEKRDEAFDCAVEMRAWGKSNAIKVPD